MYQLNIPKMNCGSCANKIKNALLQIDDEAKIKVDVANRVVSIETDALIEDIKYTLSTVGYPAS